MQRIFGSRLICTLLYSVVFATTVGNKRIVAYHVYHLKSAIFKNLVLYDGPRVSLALRTIFERVSSCGVIGLMAGRLHCDHWGTSAFNGLRNVDRYTCAKVSIPHIFLHWTLRWNFVCLRPHVTPDTGTGKETPNRHHDTDPQHPLTLTMNNIKRQCYLA